MNRVLECSVFVLTGCIICDLYLSMPLCEHFISSSLDIFAARLAISVEIYES